MIMPLQGVKQNIDWRTRVKIEKGCSQLFKHPLWFCNFIFINCNYVAHNLAKWAKHFDYSGEVEVNSLPTDLFCNTTESYVPLDSDSIIHKKKVWDLPKLVSTIHFLYA